MKSLLALTAVILSTVMYGQEDFSGTYFFDSPYAEVMLTITQAGEGYRLDWKAGDLGMKGKGLATDGVMAGLLFDQEAGTVVLNLVLEKTEEGFSGCTFLEDDRCFQTFLTTTGVDTLKPGEIDVTGSYAIEGESPADSAGYSGSLVIERNGDFLEANRQTAGQELAGIGLVAGEVLILSYDIGYETMLGLYRMEADTLSGIWFGCPDEELGNMQPVNTGIERCVRRR
ncbi:MAG: hypothetical protein JW724_08270 [Candidatus Altiarchaeota archaeon]|nr:hypothetical protein [Candidatus Altiarchaeota archaeon]